MTAQYIQMKKTEWDCRNSRESLWKYVGSCNIKHRGQYKHGRILVGCWLDVAVGSFRGVELRIAQREREM